MRRSRRVPSETKDNGRVGRTSWTRSETTLPDASAQDPAGCMSESGCRGQSPWSAEVLLGARLRFTHPTARFHNELGSST